MLSAGCARRAPDTPAARQRESPAQARHAGLAAADPGLGGSLLSRTPDVIPPPPPHRRRARADQGAAQFLLNDSFPVGVC